MAIKKQPNNKYKELIKKIVLESIPILIMLSLVYFIKDDHILALSYIFLIVGFFNVHYEKNDLKMFFLGLILMTFFEFVFLKVGIEKFNRTTLLNIMPIWLPLFWGYVFVVIKRVSLLLNEK